MVHNRSSEALGKGPTRIEIKQIVPSLENTTNHFTDKPALNMEHFWETLATARGFGKEKHEIF